MGIQYLNSYVENKISAACVPVDLLKISRSIAYRRAGHVKGPQYNRLCLVVDGECCLDRLYGGYFSGRLYLTFTLVTILLAFLRAYSHDHVKQILGKILKSHEYLELRKCEL